MLSVKLILPPDPVSSQFGFSELAEMHTHAWLNRERQLSLRSLDSPAELLMRHDGLLVTGEAYTQEAVLDLAESLLPRLSAVLLQMFKNEQTTWLVPALFNPVAANLTPPGHVLYLDPAQRLVVQVSASSLPQGEPAEYWYNLLTFIPEMAWDGIWMQTDKVLLAVRSVTPVADVPRAAGIRCPAYLGAYLVLRRRLQNWQPLQLASYLRMQGEPWAVRVTRRKFAQRPTSGSLRRWLDSQLTRVRGLSQEVGRALSFPTARQRLPWAVPKDVPLQLQLQYLADQAGQDRRQRVQRFAHLCSHLSTVFRPTKETRHV